MVMVKEEPMDDNVGAKLKYLGPCGVYCQADCATMRILTANDESARRRLAEDLTGDAERWREITCDGCRGEKVLNVAGIYCWGRDCSIRECALDRQVDYCCECPAYPCAILSDLREADPMIARGTEALEFIRTHGARAWLERRIPR